MKEVILLSNPPAPITHKSFQGVPKIFFPFFDKILLDFYISYFKYNKITKIFVNYYEIKENSSDYFLGKWYLGDFLDDIEINIFKEGRVTGNIGAIKKLENYLNTDDVFICHTGGVPLFSLKEAFDFHRNNRGEITIITNNQINNVDEIPPNYCFILNKNILKNIKKNIYIDFRSHLLKKIEKSQINFYNCNNQLLPLISYYDYINIIKFVIKNNPLPFFKISDEYIIDKDNFYALHKYSLVKTKNIKNSIIGKNSIIEKEVFISNTIIDDNVKIESKCFIDRSYIKSSEYIKGNTVIIDNKIIKNIKLIKSNLYFEEKLWEKFFDYGLLFLFTPVVVPMIIIISLLILIFDGPPVFFIQERIGKNRKPFKMIKFRTMRKDAEKIKSHLKRLNEIDGPMFKISNDPRVTKIGKFLRKTSLDELPQLFNILKGEMSFVGPRPLSMEEMIYHPQWRDLRVKVKPGLTGLWQVKKNQKETFSDWIIYDTSYIINKSPYLYIKIIFLTFFYVLFRKNK